MKPLYFLRPGVRILLKENLIVIPGEGMVPISPSSAKILEKLSVRPLLSEEVKDLPESMSQILLKPFQPRYENPKALGADYLRCSHSEATTWVLESSGKVSVKLADCEFTLPKGVYLFPLYRPEVNSGKLISVKGSNPRKDREEWILKVLKKLKARSILELGCGDSRSLELGILEKIPGSTYAGIDKSVPARGSRIQKDFLKELPTIVPGTIAVAEEVIEHLRLSALPKLVRSLDENGFSAFVLTTPNQKFTKMMGRKIRHHDHKFEWTWNEARAWASEMSRMFDAKVEVKGIGRKWKGVYPTWGIVIRFR